MISNKNFDELEFFLKNNYCAFQKDYLIKYDTYFKTGGRVKFFLMPLSVDELKYVISYLQKHNLHFKIIGFTSNLFLLDEVEYSVIISTKNLKKVNKNEKGFCVEAGYALSDLVRIAIINQAKGFEGLEGIPASVGGALFMNAGAYGHSISDNLISVDCINQDNDIITLTKEECGFSYRTSIFKNGNYIIVSARFNFIKGDRLTIAKNVETFHIARHSYQDFVYPNLGSMISIPINIYQRILKKDKTYIFKYWLLKYIYKNPFIKFINRKRP
ncbi:MAG: FAD-binding protein, partial [Flavobacteriaceae bacterium]|nr:FAD-binding protein [Flavobacteriaceae bacterium]